MEFSITLQQIKYWLYHRKYAVDLIILLFIILAIAAYNLLAQFICVCEYKDKLIDIIISASSIWFAVRFIDWVKDEKEKIDKTRELILQQLEDCYLFSRDFENFQWHDVSYLENKIAVMYQSSGAWYSAFTPAQVDSIHRIIRKHSDVAHETFNLIYRRNEMNDPEFHLLDDDKVQVYRRAATYIHGILTEIVRQETAFRAAITPN